MSQGLLVKEKEKKSLLLRSGRIQWLC